MSPSQIYERMLDVSHGAACDAIYGAGFDAGRASVLAEQAVATAQAQAQTMSQVSQVVADFVSAPITDPVCVL